MIEGLVLLLVFQLLGNVAEMYFHLPVPGSVLGMFLSLTPKSLGPQSALGFN